jgi:hypothetical protein
MRKLIALSLLAAFAGMDLSVAPAASAQAPASGMAVATGTVTSASGAAMAGQTVDLYAWPSDAVQKALKPGQLVPTTLLATATTSSAGKYMLLVPIAKLKAAAVDSGYANLEIFSAVGGFWFFPYQTGSLPAQPAAPVIVNLGAKKRVTCGKPKNGQRLYFTGQFKRKQLNPAWAVVGQGYIGSVKTRGDTVQFNYDRTGTQTQTSSLGLGLSGYGISAGYSSSGTSTSTADAEEDFATQHRNAWFRTEFNTALFRGMCVAGEYDTVPHLKQHGHCPRTWTDDNGVKLDVLQVHLDG